jgi:methylated-DNA-[protein]-cysteine S-methyltransferase
MEVPMPAEFCMTMTTPLGDLRLLARHERLVGVVILAPAAGVQPGSRPAPTVSGGIACSLLRQASRELAEYFAGRRQAFEVPLDLSGWPPFTRKILEELRKVPYGETLTYGELAARAGCPRAARAVGQAMAANPLPIIIPCHRVVAADGRLGGYSGGDGLPTKQWLLAFEQGNRPRR